MYYHLTVWKTIMKYIRRTDRPMDHHMLMNPAKSIYMKEKTFWGVFGVFWCVLGCFDGPVQWLVDLDVIMLNLIFVYILIDDHIVNKFICIFLCIT